MDDVLESGERAALGVLSAADDVPRLDQLIDAGLDGADAVRHNRGQPPDADLPVVRETQQHGKQPLCLKAQPLIAEMVVCHDGIVMGLFDAIHRHYHTPP